MNKKTFLIIDGHNLLFQMFFGMPNKIQGKNNQYIQGVIGFIGALRRIISEVEPTNILVVFDSETGGTRNALDENYKANRIDYTSVPEEDSPFSQLPLIYQCLDYLNMPYVEIPNVEADDVIASNALFYQKDFKIVISSFDTDYYQLINDNIVIYKYRGKKSQYINQEIIACQLHIKPKYYVEYKSLIGDAADNIKGVPTIGPVRASCLINEYGDINKIIANLEFIKNPSLKIALTTNLERFKHNYSLIKLTLNQELVLDIVNTESPILEFKTMEILKKLEIV